MKKIFLFLLLIASLLVCRNALRAQAPHCDPDVPYYEVDLTGQPAGSWVSPVHSRHDHCCSAFGPSICTSFKVTLDTGAAMISFEIASGAIPSGSMYYQVSTPPFYNCGPPIAVGQPICLYGAGPFYVTFCKPGNNTNTYRITSIAKPTFPKDDTARIGCSLPIHVLGMQQSSITWNSVYPGSAGDYNSYLDLTDPDTAIYTPAAGAPPYIDYVICGTPIAPAICGYFPSCDTVRIYNFSALSASVTPNPANFCQGGGGVLLSSSVSGGQTPYSYTWYNDLLQIVGSSSTYTATAAGNYQLAVRDMLYDSVYCPAITAGAAVTVTLLPVVNAGADTTVCPTNPAIILHGTAQNAPGGITWTGGAGTFNPGSTSLITAYTPTPAEIAAGQVTLILSSTGTGGGCTEDSDTMTVYFPTPISISFANTNPLCNGGTGTLTPTVTGGTPPYSYQWTTGAVTSSITATAGIYCLTITDSLSCASSSCGTITAPSALLITTTSTPCSVNGGSDGTATATVSGGTAPYSYLWSTGGTTATISGLAYGIYSVTVTDANGCQIVSSVVVNEPRCNGFQAVATGSDADCFNGQNGMAVVTVTNGTPNYTYLWNDIAAQTNDTASSLAAGVYECIVTDANNCSDVATVTIGQPTQLVNTMTHTNVSTIGGNDGSATATVSGGTPAYTYSWSNGGTTASISTLTAGSYSVTIGDSHSCTLTDSVRITEPPCNNLTVSVFTSPVSCNGGSNGSANAIVLFGTNPVSYLWSTGATTPSISGLAAGNYNVAVTDGLNCSTFVNFTITQPSPLMLGLSPTDVRCSYTVDGTIDLTVTGGTFPYTFVWTNGTATEDQINLNEGSYTVTVTDANGCTATDSATISRPAPIVATSVITPITCNGGSNGAIDATVTGGIAPYSYSWSNAATTEDISGLSAGNYVLNVTDANNCVLLSPYDVPMNEPDIVHIDSLFKVCPVPGSGLSEVIVYPGGGNPGAYQVSFDNGVNYLASGIYDVFLPVDSTYYVMVRDTFGCLKAAADTLIIAPAVDIQSVTFNPCIADGVTSIPVAVNVTGGNGGPLMLSFDNGSTYLAPGTYSTVLATGSSYTILAKDSSSCLSLPETISISTDIVLSGTTSQFNGYQVSCFGSTNGSIDLSASGGAGTLTYSWSNAATTQDLSGLAAGTYSVIVTDTLACSDTLAFTLTQPAQLTNTLVATSSFNGGYEISCNGATDGAVNLTISGGVTPYTYAWSNGATTEDLSGLAAGTYSVSVTDANGCTTTNTITLTQPNVLAAGIVAQRVFCNGSATGGANLTVTGGTTPYSYAWSNGATTEDISSLLAGSYSVTVTDANGCTTTASTTITQPPALTASGVTTNLTCFQSGNGAINLTVGGGILPYSYSWSNSATTEDLSNLAAGSYSVTVLDSAGCSLTRTFTITEPAPLTASVVITTNFNGYNVSCFGSTNGAINLTVNGGTAPYSYSWSNSATTEDLSNIGAGTYSVTVTDANGCIATASVTLIQPPVLSSGIVAQRVFCNGSATGGANLTVTGGVPAYSYAWSNGATTEDISSLLAGSYSVTVTDANGCTTTASTTITQPPALTASGVTTNLTCFQSGNGAIDLTVGGGILPYSYSWSNSATTEDLSNLAAGSYSVTVLDSAGCNLTRSFTITEPAPLTASVVITTNFNGYNVSCFGSTNGAVDLTVSGGTPGYTFSWSNSATTEDLSNIGAGTYSVTVTDANGCIATGSVTLVEPPALASGIIAQNVFCNGAATGWADLTVTGGVQPYAYSWSNSATTEDLTALPAGTYSVSVTDANGCMTTAGTVITEPAPLVLSGVTTNLNCYQSGNGAIDLTVNGGIQPYTYSWSNSATTEDLVNIGAGVFVVTVIDSANCSQVDSFTITQPAAVIASAIITTDYNGYNVSCAGSANGAIDLIVNGGTPAYTYGWSNGATTEDLSSIPAGTYSVLVTDANGCQTADVVTLNEPAALDISATHQDVPCNGFLTGSIDITISGGVQPLTYSWSNGATTEDIGSLGDGVYTVNVTDANGCLIDTTVEITESAPVVVTGVTTNPLCFGVANGSIDLTVTGGTAPYGYNWSNGETIQDPAGLAAGSYSVIVSDANNCQASDTLQLAEPAEIITTISSPVYPGGHNVSMYGGSDGSIDLNVTGGTVPYQYTWNNGGTTQDLTGLPAGNYSVIVTDANGCMDTNSIVLNQPMDLAMPTGYSPNQDGFNDAFVVRGIEAYPDNRIEVFNRWGNLVYDADNYQNTWQGTANTGDSLPDGTYFVVLTINDGSITLKGYVDLRRH